MTSITADQVAKADRDGDRPISTRAVYDALGGLTGAGLARRLEPAGSPARSETTLKSPRKEKAL